jgi:lipopolysaccharide transport system ATP-binding protein
VSRPAVRVERIGKRYRLGQRLPYRSLRETLTTAVRGRLRGQRTEQRETIWALRDVSFEVAEGEVIGIIGRNGAGKSTLLKILARITDPTEGRVEVHGRVGSLLEVGTGFHMELTGRENIFLNGAILGMKRAEIQRKFDEIVAFAEIDQFLDTPVKHYSTGMYLRLAFAVAAHLEPEILLVDEVLAVGDAAFQKKCLGKMGDVAMQGHTVLLVSHNMGAVKALCEKALYLDAGSLAAYDETERCISHYLNLQPGARKAEVELPPRDTAPVQLLRVAVRDEHACGRWEFPHDRPFIVRIELIVRERLTNVFLAMHIHDQDLATILFSRDFETDTTRLEERKPGHYRYEIQIPACLLVPGEYSLSVHVAQRMPGRIIDGVDHACSFAIVDNGSINARMGFPWRGKLAVPLSWKAVEGLAEDGKAKGNSPA